MAGYRTRYPRTHSRTEESLPEYLKRKYYRQDGTAVIEVNLYEGFSLYDPLTHGGGRQLNPDIYELIEEQSNLIPSFSPLRIRFCGREVPPEEQEEVRRMYSEHYQSLYYDREWDRRSNRTKFVGMLGFGILMMVLYLYRSYNSADTLFLELLSVLASFSLWSAADLFLMGRREIKEDLQEIVQCQEAEITFGGK